MISLDKSNGSCNAAYDVYIFHAIVNSILRAKKVIVGILERGSLKILVDDSVIVGDEILKSVTNTIPTNVTFTVSVYSDDRKIKCKMDCYILQKILLVTKLLFKIAINCYHYMNYRSKQKHIDMEKNNELKISALKIIFANILMTKLKLKIVISLFYCMKNKIKKYFDL